MNLFTQLGRSFGTLLKRPYRTAGVSAATTMVDDGALLLDVREPAEWRAGHAPDAQHIPLGQLTSRLAEVPAGRTVVTVCRSGVRSARAAAVLARAGHDVVNLRGGMLAWQGSGRPVVGQGGRPGRV